MLAEHVNVLCGSQRQVLAEVVLQFGSSNRHPGHSFRQEPETLKKPDRDDLILRRQADQAVVEADNPAFSSLYTRDAVND